MWRRDEIQFDLVWISVSLYANVCLKCVHSVVMSTCIERVLPVQTERMYECIPLKVFVKL